MKIPARRKNPSGSFWPRLMREAPRIDWLRQTPPPRTRSVLLISPWYPKNPHASYAKHVLTPALSLTSIAAATPPDWEVRIWDENLLQGPPPGDPFPDLVGITVQISTAGRAYELARWYRERGARVVLGGMHLLASSGEAARHADSLVLGEGVQVWPGLLRDAAGGRLAPLYEGSYRNPYREDPQPRRELLSGRDFLTRLSLIATRGCRNRCSFCHLSTRGLELPCQVRDVQQVVQELRAGPEPYGVFIDNNLGARPGYLRGLCRALRPVGKIWSAAVDLEITGDPGLVREMALAGCTGVFVGFESLMGENLARAGKRIPRPEEYARRVEIFHRHGIQVNGSFVFGFDHDRPDIFSRTIRWIEEVRLECATFHILTPYPGTPLFRQLELEGRILHRNWDLYDTSHTVFRPRHMSPEELEEGYSWCYRRVCSLGSIWRRRPRRAGEVLPYLGMSLLYKRANFLWPLIIRSRLTGLLWRPLVLATRRRHLRFRRRLEAATEGIKDSLHPMRSGVTSPHRSRASCTRHLHTPATVPRPGARRPIRAR